MRKTMVGFCVKLNTLRSYVRTYRMTVEFVDKDTRRG